MTMNKIIGIALALLVSTAAHAADNAIVLTPGTGVTMRSIDIGAGVQAPGHALVDASGAQLGISGAPLYIRGASAAFASGAFASGAFATGSMVDLLTIIGSKTGGTAAASSSLAGCVYNTSAPTLTNGQQAGVQCTVNGYPIVSVNNTNANGQATMANSSPVVIASNQTANALWGHGVTGAAVPANATYFGFNSGGNLTGPAVATPLPVRQSDGTNVAALDPCQTGTVNSTPINISTATTTRIATESASVKIYICHLSIVTNAANNVALIEGTGASCSGGTPAGMAGGTTASSGWNFSANGGISLGMGGYSINQTANQAYSVCLVTSAATQLSGVMKWVAR